MNRHSVQAYVKAMGEGVNISIYASMLGSAPCSKNIGCMAQMVP